MVPSSQKIHETTLVRQTTTPINRSPYSNQCLTITSPRDRHDRLNEPRPKINFDCNKFDYPIHRRQGGVPTNASRPGDTQLIVSQRSDPRHAHISNDTAWALCASAHHRDQSRRPGEPHDRPRRGPAEFQEPKYRVARRCLCIPLTRKRRRGSNAVTGRRPGNSCAHRQPEIGI